MNEIVLASLQKRIKFLTTPLSNSLYNKNISVILVNHVLESSLGNIHSIETIYSLEKIIAKPKSIDHRYVEYSYPGKHLYLKRDDISIEKFKLIIADVPKENKVVIVDIGGYFSSISNEISAILGDKFLGIVEDTENGFQRYSKIENVTYPVVSVARSPLKINEDFLVGQGCVFAVEKILREVGMFINNQSVGVIGFGKIGKGLLSALQSRDCYNTIFDSFSPTLLESYCKGNKVTRSIIDLLQTSNIVFCATGSKSISGEDFFYIKNGAFISSVTSSDDELDVSFLNMYYKKTTINEYIDKYTSYRNFLFLINQGNATNFLVGGGAGEYMPLIQKEIIEAISLMNQNVFLPGLTEVSDEIRNEIGNLWFEHFM